ncbi:hypothetical protein [Mumia sp. DW29H23]|uniref:hypothetical protein n=1 Tax=Mumia sp. DW29H23 TaxID=3421241 RepID=UPI003D68FA4E
MDTTTLIQASAKVVTITELKPGDVYKRVDDAYGGTKLIFGIVRDVMNNGTDAAFTALEVESGYQPTPTVKVFKAGASLSLFAARPDEVSAHLVDVQMAAARRVADAERALTTAHEAFDAVVAIRDDISRGHELTPATTGAIDGQVA